MGHLPAASPVPSSAVMTSFPCPPSAVMPCLPAPRLPAAPRTQLLPSERVVSGAALLASLSSPASSPDAQEPGMPTPPCSSVLGKAGQVPPGAAHSSWVSCSSDWAWKFLVTGPSASASSPTRPPPAPTSGSLACALGVWVPGEPLPSPNPPGDSEGPWPQRLSKALTEDPRLGASQALETPSLGLLSPGT